jgi:hypothetical protein
MNSINTTDSSEGCAAACWVRQALYAVLAALALIALVAAFAVEFASVSPDVRQSAHKLLQSGESAVSPG